MQAIKYFITVKLYSCLAGICKEIKLVASL